LEPDYEQMNIVEAPWIWRIWQRPSPQLTRIQEIKVTILLLVLSMLLTLVVCLRRRSSSSHHIEQQSDNQARLCEQQMSSMLLPLSAGRIASNVELAALRYAEPALARKIDAIISDTEWLQCFWVASDHDVEATIARIRCYASWGQDCELDQPQLIEILSAGLIDILPGGGDDCAVVAVVRDIQTICRLLQTHSFQDVIAAHLMQLKLLLKTSSRARQYGVSMVHDLSRLNWALIRRMMDPRNLQAQLQASRLLFTAFPVRFETIVVVDAPPSFGMILNAVKAVAPGAIPNPLQFVYRPEAVSHCVHVFGQRVL
jgi:hypothetical protein